MARDKQKKLQANRDYRARVRAKKALKRFVEKAFEVGGVLLGARAKQQADKVAANFYFDKKGDPDKSRMRQAFSEAVQLGHMEFDTRSRPKPPKETREDTERAFLERMKSEGNPLIQSAFFKSTMNLWNIPGVKNSDRLRAIVENGGYRDINEAYDDFLKRNKDLVMNVLGYEFTYDGDQIVRDSYYWEMYDEMMRALNNLPMSIAPEFMEYMGL